MTNDKKYDGLRKAIDEQKTWPGTYMFKFIMYADNKAMAQVENLFSADAKIYRKESKNGKYLSITVEDLMFDSDHVISIYKKAEKIPNLMIL